MLFEKNIPIFGPRKVPNFDVLQKKKVCISGLVDDDSLHNQRVLHFEFHLEFEVKENLFLLPLVLQKKE